ncbi:MAG TPA: hypothetical protein DIT64_01715 [Verrucomicrobiales bacterium]|nr:hypothetical protein [Verrucomicrobiales bacterium]
MIRPHAARNPFSFAGAAIGRRPGYFAVFTALAHVMMAGSFMRQMPSRVLFMLGVTAGIPAQNADLSLPPVDAAAGRRLQAGGERVASALAHYSTALRLEVENNPRAALEHYLKALEVDPSNASLAMHTAELAYSFRGRETAVALLEKTVEANPDAPEPYLNLARFCATYAPDDPFENDRAKLTLDRALKRFPRSAEVHGFAAVTLLSQGQRDEAARVLDGAARQNVSDSQHWLTLGRAAQKVWPLGQAEMREEHTARVNVFFQNALRHAPADDEAARLEVARYYLLTNQLRPARDLCLEISRQTGSLQARKLLHRLHESFEEKEQALRVLEKIVEDAPDDVEYRRMLARAYELREEYARAAPHYETALQKGGGSAEDYLHLGETLLRAYLNEKLIEFCKRSAMLFPDQAMFHVQAAMANRALQQWDDAVACFEKAAALAESNQAELVNHRFYFQYGVTLERAGRHEDAGRMFEKSITVTPKEDVEAAASAMNYLGYMWLELDRHFDKAGELILKANELQPETPAYVDSLGWWHFKKGNHTEALRELERAVSLIPDLQAEDAEIIEHIGRVHLAMKQPQKAIEAFQKALSLRPEDEKVLRQIKEGLDKAGK